MRSGFVRGLVVAGGVLLGSAGPSLAAFDYVAGIETVAGEVGGVARGLVFEDLSRDGLRQAGQPGIAGVIVSNGRDVAATGADGEYTLPAYDNMTVMISRPAGWMTPLDADGAPQFFYHHKPAGTPGPLRFGGLPATGPLPAAINFPLVQYDVGDDFACVAMGDPQPYSNNELGFVRDGVIDSILARDLGGRRTLPSEPSPPRFPVLGRKQGIVADSGRDACCSILRSPRDFKGLHLSLRETEQGIRRA